MTTLASGDGFTIQGDDASDRAGYSVSDAGDVNGDGIDDFIVGATGAGSSGRGAAYVIFGTRAGFPTTFDLTNLAASQGFVIKRDTSVVNLGFSVSSAGDVNGDHIDDLVVSAPGFGSGSSDPGQAYVIFGTRAGFPATLDLATLTSTQGFTIRGETGGDYAGWSVSSAGDVNGDGFDDLIVGAKGNGSTTFRFYGVRYPNHEGAAYVIYGKNSGFGPIDLATLGSGGFKVLGDTRYDAAGFSVSSAGDVNGDGIDDIIVGAPYGDNGGGNAGEAYVIFGVRGARGTLDLTNLTSAQGFIIQGDSAADQMGRSVSAAGDVNGDGIDDLIVGGTGYNGGTSSGEVYVIFGTRDGFGSTLSLTSLTAAQGFVMRGGNRDWAGWSVSAAGDVNGDGIGDLIVGAPNRQGVGATGKAYVIFGTTGGFGLSVDLTNLTSTQGFVIEGDAVDNMAGFSVSAAGDVNGDGIDDLLVGAPLNSKGGTNAGAAYVIYGRRAAPPDALPDAVDDGVAATSEETSATYSEATLLANDSQGDAPATITAAGGATHGSVVLNADRSITFTPTADYSGPASFTYTITDADGDSDTATVTLTVNGVDDPAVATDDSATVAENATATVAVLANDIDVDGPGPSVATVNGATLAAGQSTTLASGARVTYNADGTLTYDPSHAFDSLTAAGSGATNTSAVDTFAYTVNGGDAATVSVTVNGVASPEDSLAGDGSDNSITGTPDNDRLSGNGGDDVLNGGGGRDELYGGAGRDRLDGGDGGDFLDGGTGADSMTGGTGNDSYRIDDGNDRVVEAAGGGYDRAYTSVGFALEPGSEIELLATLDSGGTDPINLTGNDFTQLVVGNGAANMLAGLGGDDELRGLDGDDALYGGAGDDVLDGGRGSDVMEGGFGNDIYFVDGPGDVVRENAGEGTDYLYTSVGYALGVGSFVEFMATTDSSGTDAIDLSGSNSANTLIGNDGANVLSGGGGDDDLVGLGGNDRLDGGAGQDILEGGAGADIFRFEFVADSTAQAADRIRSFESGVDRIDLSLVDQNLGLSGGTPFHWIGSDAFSGASGELRYELVGNTIYVTGDSDGDGIADFGITLDNTTVIAQSDFIF